MWDSTKWHKQKKKFILTKGKAYKDSLLFTILSWDNITAFLLHNLPGNSKTSHPPSLGIWLEFCSTQWIIWPKMRNAQSGIWLLCQNSGQRCKQKDFEILPAFSMCSALLQYSMFIGAFESLLESLLNLAFPEWKILMNKPL